MRHVNEATSTAIVVYKAQSIDTQIIPDFTISSGEAVPKGGGDAFHRWDAQRIANALQGSLPGGTWDHLVAEMVRRHASLLRVRR
jgi:hypothetical protein